MEDGALGAEETRGGRREAGGRGIGAGPGAQFAGQGGADAGRQGRARGEGKGGGSRSAISPPPPPPFPPTKPKPPAFALLQYLSRSVAPTDRIPLAPGVSPHREAEGAAIRDGGRGKGGLPPRRRGPGGGARLRGRSGVGPEVACRL